LLEENFLLRRCSGHSTEPDVLDVATRSAQAQTSLRVSYFVDGVLDPRFEVVVLAT
jgi:hypothetical protein